MDPVLSALIIAVITGLVVGGFGGWYAAHEVTRRNNRKMAEQMAASVGAVRSRRKPEDMLEYDNRQRTTAPNNGKKARQAKLRPRRVMRRPSHRG